jgi:hypothetical protein
MIEEGEREDIDVIKSGSVVRCGHVPGVDELSGRPSHAQFSDFYSKTFQLATIL